MPTFEALRTELLAQPGVVSMGDPVQQGNGTAGESGYGLYNCSTFYQQGGMVRHVQVAVLIKDLGQPGEDAGWHGDEPLSDLTTNDFRKWMLSQYRANPGNFPGLIIHKIDEVAETAIVSWFAGDWTRTFYFIERGQAAQALPSFDLAMLEYDVPLVGRDR